MRPSWTWGHIPIYGAQNPMINPKKITLKLHPQASDIFHHLPILPKFSTSCSPLFLPTPGPFRSPDRSSKARRWHDSVPPALRVEAPVALWPRRPAWGDPVDIRCHPPPPDPMADHPWGDLLGIHGILWWLINRDLTWFNHQQNGICSCHGVMGRKMDIIGYTDISNPRLGNQTRGGRLKTPCCTSHRGS